MHKTALSLRWHVQLGEAALQRAGAWVGDSSYGVLLFLWGIVIAASAHASLHWNCADLGSLLMVKANLVAVHDSVVWVQLWVQHCDGKCMWSYGLMCVCLSLWGGALQCVPLRPSIGN